MQVTSTTIKSQMISKLGHMRPRTAELAALEPLKNPHTLYDGGTVVTTQVPSVFDGSSFLQVTRMTIKAWMSLNFGQIPSPTME